jgi:single-stranded-DNA-specific exonuclease
VAGSARSIRGFNLYEAIDACRDYLIGYGGHFAAAGLSMLPENVEAFSKKFEEVVSASIDPSLLIPELLIDTELAFRNISKGFYKILSEMEPYGPDNPRPVFISRNVQNAGSRIVKDLHIRFRVQQENITFTGMGFNLADKFSLLLSGAPLDLAYTLDENEWNSQTTLQLKVIGLRLSENLSP